MISINSYSYKYPHSSENALAGISFQIQAGEFVVLAGESGSGKTTLLRAINGLVPHFSGGVIEGQVSVMGINVIDTGPQQLSKWVGFVNQNPEGQAILDVVEREIAFALENNAVAANEMRIRVNNVLNLLALTSLKDRDISTLSGGERQRVAIAAAMALQPKILLLDEPTSQLDPQSAEEVLLSLVRLNQDLGLTVVLAEHRLERVLRYANRLIYLQNGRILVDDAIQDALLKLPQLPPLIEIGRRLGWSPLPLTIKEGQQFSSSHPQSLSPIFRSYRHDLKHSNNGRVPLLSVSNVRFSYSGKQALEDIDLELHSGEILTVMGRNGSGKTTLLKCIVGLLQVDSGDITIFGESIKDKEVHEIAKHVAYLPQHPDDLLFAETVVEELEITLKNHGLIPTTEVAEILEQLGLTNNAQSYPRDLSTGQRQRVALGAVAVTHPQIYLLDEPTRGLDGKSKEKLVKIWRDWVKRGAGLVIVTHDVELVAQISDRVIILREGENDAVGTTREVLTASPLFAPQISRLFPNRGWLTVEEALNELNIDRRSEKL